MDMGILSNRAGPGVNTPAARTDVQAATPVRPEIADRSEELKTQSMAEPDREQMLAAVADMQDYIDTAGRNIQFQLDEESGRMVVTVTEASSGDVIRQMPSEEALRLAENLSEMRSVLFSGET